MRIPRILLFFLLFVGAAHAADIYVSPSGSDSNAGSSSAPKKTIQAGVNLAKPGDRVIVRAGTYKEPNRTGSESYYGIHIERSGTQSAPITIMSETKGAAIIDQDLQAAGFVLWTVSDVKITGFTIRDCKWGGVYMTHHQTKQRIVVDNNTITNCDGDEGSNVGGVYMSSCTGCTISNNTISDIKVGGRQYQNGAGIHGYDQERSIIEGNTISKASNGIYHKKSSGEKGLIIRRNVIRDVTQGIWYSISAAGNPPHIDQEVYENVISASDNCIRGSSNETSSPSRGLTVRNNVLTNCWAGVITSGFENIVVQNNIFYNVDDAIVTQYGEWRSELVKEDHNLFYPEVSFRLQQYASEQRLSSLSSWKSYTGFGQSDLTGDPQFVAPSSFDFTLKSSSPAKNAGSDGRDIGAYPGGGTSVVRPMPPVISVQ
ncbi:MAG TPA: right-handed parallel beta-helix repeat-containing protein [Steroidobacter sp.]|uniref:right-handed parallel beta-helix repeat-containing protein n=1 Tax=Steroidobacter sp. TaxID=1978227 RepID=UPI002ED94F20